MTRSHFFTDTDDLVAYLYSKHEDLSLLRLQKTLYLLYAFYGATYGSITAENQADFEQVYPKELFPAKFEAWRYGPVIFDVYTKQKDCSYEGVQSNFLPETKEEKDVLTFIDELLKQIDEMSDFGLVDRTHQDESWKKVYREGEHHIPMSNESIIKEYRENYVG